MTPIDHILEGLRDCLGCIRGASNFIANCIAWDEAFLDAFPTEELYKLDNLLTEVERITKGLLQKYSEE